MYLNKSLEDRYGGRIEAGITLFDNLDSGWWKTDAENPIDTDTLDMSDETCCALAQHSGTDFFTAQKQIGLSDYRATMCGLIISGKLSEEQQNIAWDVLNEGWKAAITERRLAAEYADQKHRLAA